MALAGILASNLFNLAAHNTQNRSQQFQQEFQQLGKDLQSGNLTAAQSDFDSLQQLAPQSNSASSSSSPVAQAFQQLSVDLQSGNVAAAQQDYANLQQDFQNQARPTQAHHHRHVGKESNPMSQLFDQLGQALDSGNLSAAQQAYSSLLQDFQQLSQSGSSTKASTQPNSSGLSISA